MPDRRRWLVPLISVGVVVLLFIGTMLFVAWRAASEAEALRGEPPAIEVVSPQGEAGSRPVSFVWRSHGVAALYRLEVLTASGDVLFTSETRDTAVALPVEVVLTAGVSYQWSVSARSPDGQEAQSPAVSFTP